MDKYLKQAKDFMEKTNSSMEVKYLKTDKYFDDDKYPRDIYEVTISRGNRSYAFKFGQSWNASGKFWKYGDYRRGIANTRLIGEFMDKNKNYAIPNEYDVLACLQKYDPGLFEDFCSEYGCDTDSKKAERTYQAVRDEYLNLAKLYNDKELAELTEIS